MNIVAVVTAAAILGACIAAAVTWLVWSQGWSNWFPEAPFVLMVTAYATVSVVGLGKRDASLWAFAAAFLVGLVLTVVVGMTISEVIHAAAAKRACLLPLRSRVQ